MASGAVPQVEDLRVCPTGHVSLQAGSSAVSDEAQQREGDNQAAHPRSICHLHQAEPVLVKSRVDWQPGGRA
jgi:hypothetical protein